MQDAEQLDQILNELAQKPTEQSRRNALQSLVEFWHGPIVVSDGYSPGELAKIKLPKALQWWYGWAGKRSRITSGEGQFLRPEQLAPPNDEGLVTIWTEGRGAFRRAIPAVGADPPIYHSGWTDGEHWRDEGMSVVGFLMQLCVLESQSEFWGFLDIVQPQLEIVTTIIPRLPVHAWKARTKEHKYLIDFHVGRGIFATVHDLGCSPAGIRAYTLTVRAKSPEPLRELDALLQSPAWEFKNF
jgi:hypothetical protein